jgi:hypothetical protein
MTNPMNLAVCDDGNPPRIWFAKISHEFKNDHHVFKSDSIPGLFIAHQDPMKAFGQIIPTLKALILANTGQNVTVSLGEDFKEFQKAHSSSQPTIKDTMVAIQKVA